MIEIPGGKRRSNRVVLILVFVVFILFLGSNTALSYFVNSLWFGSLGYREVFWKSTGLQWGVFVVVFALTFLLLYGWFLALWRMHQADLPHDRAVFIGQQRLSLPLRRVLRIAGMVLSLGIALISGVALMSEWPTFALFWYAPRTASRLDPIFARPVSFYLFDLPAWQLVAGWLMVLAVIACIAAGAFLLLSGGSRSIPRQAGSLVLPLPWRGVSIAFS